MELEDVVKAHSVGFDIEEVKVEFKHELKMDVSGVKIEGKESEIMNIPRWVAEILESEKHIILHEGYRLRKRDKERYMQLLDM